MFNLDSIQKINPAYFDKTKPVVIVTKAKKVVPPVSEATIASVKVALIAGDWLSFSDIAEVTGFTSGTVSRAARYMVDMKLAVTKIDRNGKCRKSYLKLVA
jgi:hypothetical protein